MDEKELKKLKAELKYELKQEIEKDIDVKIKAQVLEMIESIFNVLKSPFVSLLT